MFSMRFDLRVPDLNADQIAAQYRTAIDMAAWADQHEAPFMIGLVEHHASEDGYLPSPLVLASAIAAVTQRTPIMIAATLLPFYDPVRLAEDMIILDHVSRGRVSYVFGIGYRPEEYALHGLDYAARGSLADQKLEKLLQTLEAAAAATESPRVTPAPRSPIKQLVSWGGGSLAAARRAGRNGLNFFAQANFPALREAYEKAAADAGQRPGICHLPDPANPNILFAAEDLDIAWEELGSHLLHDARSYAAWNENAGRATISLSTEQTIAGLRAENGAYRVVSLEDAEALVKRWGRFAMHPLCGGVAPETGWKYLKYAVEGIWPRVKPA